MVIGWGKPRLFKKKLGDENAKWEEIPTPAEGTTQLTTTKGDKVEAKLEGGANEDVRYNANTYALAFQIRLAKGKKVPFEHNDGIITDNYAFALVPEDPEVPSGFIMDKAVVSVEDTFTSADGGAITYTLDALKPEKGNQLKWGVVKVTESGGTISSIELEEE